MPMRIPAPKQSLFHNLFTPLPSENSSSEKKDLADHISNYATTTHGAWDFARIFSHMRDWADLLGKNNPVVDTIGKVANTGGIALSVPMLLSDGNALRNSINEACAITHLPHSDPLRSKKIAQAYKKTALDGLTLTNTASQAALFLDHVKILPLKPHHFRITDGIYNGTSLVLDGADLIGQCFQLKHLYAKPVATHDATAKKSVDSKKTLAWLRVVQDCASIASACIAMVGILFGLAVQGAVFVAAASLVLSTVWLVFKISSYFYEKIVVEAPLPAMPTQTVMTAAMA